MAASPLSFVSHSPTDTWKLAERLAPLLISGDFVALVGSLGAGKTCFVQGLCRALGVKQGVRSPTFVLLQQFTVAGAVGVVNHFDLYRLEGPEQLDALGYDDVVYGDGVSIVEWPERAGTRLPGDRLTVRFSTTAEETDREVTIEAVGSRSDGILLALAAS